MSFILDALKKSESERLKRDAPGFADLPQRSRAGGAPRWIWVLAVLLLVNAVVLGGLLLRPDAAPPGEEAADAALPPAAAEPAAPPPALAIPAAAARIDPAPAAATTAGPRSQAASDRRTAPPALPAPTAEPPPTAADGLPTLAALRADGTLSLPDLHLDIHVYSSRPDERFVFVNMSKYRERETLDEGPRVREIGPDGVVLEYRDTVFLLPRE